MSRNDDIAMHQAHRITGLLRYGIDQNDPDWYARRVIDLAIRRGPRRRNLRSWLLSTINQRILIEARRNGASASRSRSVIERRRAWPRSSA